jgi:hypothetical protein
MDERDLLRIVHNLLSAVIDLVDSTEDEGTLTVVLLDVKKGTEKLVKLLDGVVDDDRAAGYEQDEDA